ncbi:unnamed protein product [Cuscuta epithymum]|uniref:Equilibrative nucleotide transporter 8 n=1 Tax=Cuscuta epithymum TaxID=186058 RepID=A0AAV0D3L8_9ASTE|nr:unnamed protein product [Cuscuta epithymum]CAH9125004.1 unnamed protein product [Cuscuta epithymum]
MDAAKFAGMESRAKEEVEVPRDTYRLAYTIHFLLGAGSLLAWNALITAVDYFEYCYPGLHVEKVFSVAYMSSSLATMVMVLVGFGRHNTNTRSWFRLRMNLGFSMFVLSLMLTPTMDWWLKKKELTNKCAAPYSAVVLSVVICGIGDGLVGGTLFGSAGKLPKQYMQAIFAGTASSGVFISALRVITKASLPQTPQGLKTSAHFYFIVSTAILVGCIACSNLLHKLPVMQKHYRLLQVDQKSSPKPRFWNVARAIRWPAFGIFMIYTVTLSIFPGFLAENIHSEMLQDWYPILLISVYNISDFLGKSMTGIYVVESIGKATWGCVGRVLMYPLFSLCLHGPNWLKTETPIIFLTITLGVTNGYFTSVLMILSPKSVPLSESEIAAIVMAVFLGIGLVSGSVLGWIWII